jgi:hypothetical protein
MDEAAQYQPFGSTHQESGIDIADLHSGNRHG